MMNASPPSAAADHSETAGSWSHTHGSLSGDLARVFPAPGFRPEPPAPILRNPGLRGVSIAENRLLARLPIEETRFLEQRLTRIDFGRRQHIATAGDQIGAALFPITNWLYQIVTLLNGNGSGAGMVGREGMVGLPLLMGDDRGMADVVSHAPCSALRLEHGAFHAAMEECPTFRKRLMLYALVTQAQALQTAACNAHHRVEQRFTRALLVAHDRAGEEPFQITHELLGILLGVRRAGITVAAGALQAAKLIEYRKGTIEVIDRAGLETEVCECYGVLRAVRRRLLCE